MVRAGVTMVRAGVAHQSRGVAAGSGSSASSWMSVYYILRTIYCILLYYTTCHVHTVLLVISVPHIKRRRGSSQMLQHPPFPSPFLQEKGSKRSKRKAQRGKKEAKSKQSKTKQTTHGKIKKKKYKTPEI